MALNLEKRAVAFLFLIFFTSMIHLSTGAVHSVGGSAGWTTIGNVDYKQWAATQNFQVGDVIGMSSNLTIVIISFLLLFARINSYYVSNQVIVLDR